MGELGDSLERMNFMQLLLLFGFVTCYVVAIGGLFGSTVRLRAAGLALLQAAAFAALTDPWVHGALLIAFAVAGLGLFVVVSWLLARALASRPTVHVADASADAPVDSLADDSTTPPSQPAGRLSDALAAAPKLARRARTARQS
jgi:hypothetical protein